MQKNKIFITTVSAVLLILIIPIHTVLAYTDGVLLKKGMSGPEVLQLQQDLKALGFFTINPTGYFGDITESSVIGFQERYGLLSDGIVGRQTSSQLDRLLRGAADVSRADSRTQLTNNNSGTLILKMGARSDEVLKLQQDLKTLGFFNVEPTGYFGEITRSAVISFQMKYGLLVDGVAGPQTLSEINSLLRRAPGISRSGSRSGEILLLPWFDKVENILSIGTVATAIDVDTGLSFKFKRTYGYNHADVETLTAQDTAVLKKIAGGYWNWTRRAIIVEVNGYRIAASLTAMPHAGREDKPANAIVDGRSGGYGRGTNLDSVKGNDMDGHFDIHFYQSRTHGTNRADEQHQAMVQKAYRSGL